MNDMQEHPLPTLSYALSCCTFVVDSSLSRGRVQGQQPPMGGMGFDSVLTNSLYIISHNLLHYIHGIIHALPCYQDQDCGYWGFPRPNFYIFGKSCERNPLIQYYYINQWICDYPRKITPITLISVQSLLEYFYGS